MNCFLVGILFVLVTCGASQNPDNQYQAGGNGQVYSPQFQQQSSLHKLLMPQHQVNQPQNPQIQSQHDAVSQQHLQQSQPHQRQAMGVGCVPNPCKNNGRCMPSDTLGYVCSCVSPWKGADCSESTNDKDTRMANIQLYPNNPFQHAEPAIASNPFNQNALNNPAYPAYSGYVNPIKPLINPLYQENPIFNQNYYQFNNPSNPINPNMPNYLNQQPYPPPNPPQNGPHNPYYRPPINSYFGQQSSGCASNPCLNYGQCISTGPYTYTCVCRYNYLGARCEDYRSIKTTILAIVLGTVLPFFAIAICVICAAYFCCCRRPRYVKT